MTPVASVLVSIVAGLFRAATSEVASSGLGTEIAAEPELSSAEESIIESGAAKATPVVRHRIVTG